MFTAEQLAVLIDLEERSSFKLLTNEARVLLIIKAHPGQSVKYYLSRSGLSYRGFYNVYNHLIENGFIEVGGSATDQRRKTVS